jgi:Cell Wall Hydrolase
MTPLDQISLALMGWKENRAGGIPGMQSCMNVALKRAATRKMTIYAVVYEPLQFSSMSYQHDPQLLIQPAEDDPQWEIAQNLAVQAALGKLSDTTGGATNYIAESLAVRPYWCSTMTETATIAGQIFFR